MRLFAAIPLQPEDCTIDARTTAPGMLWPSMAPRMRGVRQVPEDNLHLTIAFLGAVPTNQVPAIRTACKSVEMPRLSLVLSGWEWMPATRKPRVLALGVQTASDLADFAARVRTTLSPWLPDAQRRRRWRPHVTVARIGRRPVPGFVDGVMQSADLCVAWHPASWGLFVSHLHPDGARYERLWCSQL